LSQNFEIPKYIGAHKEQARAPGIALKIVYIRNNPPNEIRMNRTHVIKLIFTSLLLTDSVFAAKVAVEQ